METLASGPPTHITINCIRLINSYAQSLQDKKGNFDFSRHPSLMLKVVGRPLVFDSHMNVDAQLAMASR